MIKQTHITQSKSLATRARASLNFLLLKKHKIHKEPHYSASKTQNASTFRFCFCFFAGVNTLSAMKDKKENYMDMDIEVWLPPKHW